MAGISIATIAAIVSATAAAGGTAYGVVESQDKAAEAKKAKNEQETALYAQQKAASDATKQTEAKQAATMALARQRTLRGAGAGAAGGSTWGGTLGTGAAGAGPQFQGGLKVALGA